MEEESVVVWQLVSGAVLVQVHGWWLSAVEYLGTEVLDGIQADVDCPLWHFAANC